MSDSEAKRDDNFTPLQLSHTVVAILLQFLDFALVGGENSAPLIVNPPDPRIKQIHTAIQSYSTKVTTNAADGSSSS